MALSNNSADKGGDALKYNCSSENTAEMKLRIAGMLVLIVLLAGCGRGVMLPEPQGVSIARRGESLVDLPPTESVPVATETLTATETLPPVTASATATLSSATDTPAPSPEATSTPGSTLIAPGTAEPANTVEAPNATEAVCAPETNRQVVAEVINLVNQARIETGLAALVEQTQLTQMARRHSEAMACEGFFSHETPDGLDVEARADQAGYSFIALGEVIAAGYSSAEETVDGWLESGPHRAVLLDDTFTEIGGGYVYVPGSEYITYWTLVFGSPQ